MEMDNKNKRNIWLESEVRVMLEVFRELNITKLIDGKKYKNNEIFSKVQEEMAKLGVSSKTAVQIKNKWKALKTLYNNTKKNNSQSGSQRAICEFYDELNDILGDRPAYAIDGVDSQEVQESQQNRTNETSNEKQNLHQVGNNIQIEVDPSITEEDINTIITQVDTEEEVGNVEARKELRQGRKRKYGESKCDSSKSKDFELQFQYQRQVLKEFFESQREAEERAAKQRTSDLKLVLNTFTKTMENIFKMQTPMMPYPYVPFSPASTSSQNRSSPTRSSSYDRSSTKASPKMLNHYNSSSDSD